MLLVAVKANQHILGHIGPKFYISLINQFMLMTVSRKGLNVLETIDVFFSTAYFKRTAVGTTLDLWMLLKLEHCKRISFTVTGTVHGKTAGQSSCFYRY